MGMHNVSSIFFHRRSSSSSSNSSTDSSSSSVSAPPPLEDVTWTLRETPLMYHVRHITRGYRPHDQPWCFYFKSLFRWHNETLNVWTHLVAAVFYMWLTLQIHDQLDFRARPEALPVMLLAGASVIYTSVSAMAHWFHSKSPLIHFLCFQLDYVGISVYAVCSGCSYYFLSASEAYITSVPPALFLPVNAVLAVLICVCCGGAKLRYTDPKCVARSLWQIVSCALSTTWASGSVFHRVGQCLTLSSPPDYCSQGFSLTLFPSSSWSWPGSGSVLELSGSVSGPGSGPPMLALYWSCIIYFLMTALFYAARWPERSRRGTFDMCGHSHQIFHAVVAVTSWAQLRLALAEYGRLEAAPLARIHLYAGPMALSVMFVLVADFAFVVYTHRYRVHLAAAVASASLDAKDPGHATCQATVGGSDSRQKHD